MDTIPKDDLEVYRARLVAGSPTFLVPRVFVTDETWRTTASDGELSFLGLFRDNAPDLAAVLENRIVLILGEPGAGKSTIGRAIVQYYLANGWPTQVPILVALKSYSGNLCSLLKQNESVPASVLDCVGLSRTYVFDGMDEVPQLHRSELLRELNQIFSNEPSARIVMTSRQAFHRHHPEAFPQRCSTYHLLDLSTRDIEDFARHYSVNANAFMDVVRSVDCESEIRNPFLLKAMLERFKQDGMLSPLRSDNIGFMVRQHIEPRLRFRFDEKERALSMLAVTCETLARNVLTDEEARRVLTEVVAITPADADQLLAELAQAILVRTPDGISFQMRSFGEFLAAKELRGVSVDRLRELAFIDNEPVDSWVNTISYLAEMNGDIRRFFTNYYPAWLVNVPSQAFKLEEERTTLTRRLISDVNKAQQYFANQRLVPYGRLGRLMTDDTLNDLRAQLGSASPYEQANALVLLSLRGDKTVAPIALQIATAHHNASALRYSAILAIINSENHTVISDLIAFVNETNRGSDPYYDDLVGAVGSLCQAQDFHEVLPLIWSSLGGCGCYEHFEGMCSRDAVVAALDYLTSNPYVLNSHLLDLYLMPIMDRLPDHWDGEIADRVGRLFAGLERVQFHGGGGKLAHRIVTHAAAMDHQMSVIRATVRELQTLSVGAIWVSRLIEPLVTRDAALWIVANAPEYANDIGTWLPDGEICDILRPQTPESREQRDRIRRATLEQYEAKENQITTRREQDRAAIQYSNELPVVIQAAANLPKEHWPQITPERRSWLERNVGETLEKLNLSDSIRWITESRWTRPICLDALLKLTKYCDLHFENDVPMILALRSWPDEAISEYFAKHGLSLAALAILKDLLRTREHNSITRNVLSFLRQTGHGDSGIVKCLQEIAADSSRDPNLRTEAIRRLPHGAQTIEALCPLVDDTNDEVRDLVFRMLVKAQHRPTISRAIGRLSDQDIRDGEAQAHETSPLDWIADVVLSDVQGEVRKLRRRALTLTCWRCASLCISALAKSDQKLAARTIREQLDVTPKPWRDHLQQEAERIEQAARIAAAQGTPFDDVIRKLKGATSMIGIKVWCEGKTDRPILRRLLKEIGQPDLAKTIAFVGGWANLLAEEEPERYLDGCREAIVIMDGDRGRHLDKQDQPLSADAEEVVRRFKGHRLRLHVLKRYGIENYFSRSACEAVLQRDLSSYFPIPKHVKIEDHFSDPQGSGRFYHKGLNEKVAEHLCFADIDGTDLAEIIEGIKARAQSLEG